MGATNGGSRAAGRPPSCLPASAFEHVFRTKLVARHAANLKWALRANFRHYGHTYASGAVYKRNDPRGRNTPQLTYAEFGRMIRRCYEIELTQADLARVVARYDPSDTGRISYEVVCQAVLGPEYQPFGSGIDPIELLRPHVPRPH